jgi:hypothetical protein
MRRAVRVSNRREKPEKQADAEEGTGDPGGTEGRRPPGGQGPTLSPGSGDKDGAPGRVDREVGPSGLEILTGGVEGLVRGGKVRTLP